MKPKEKKPETRCQSADEPDYVLDSWKRIWPKDGFTTEAEWLEYCRKWWPRLPSMLDVLSANTKVSTE